MGIEVIGAGFGRTGTHSFKKAMEVLGFGKCYHMEEVFDNRHAPAWTEIAREGDATLIRDLMDKNGYRSSCDHPACNFWQEQLQMYPDAKVVLTMRDPEKWYDSWSNTITLMQPDSETCTFGSRVIFGMGVGAFNGMGRMMHEIITKKCFNGDVSKQNMIKCYKEHIQKVKDLCPPKQLLIHYSEDGWEPLCTFLGVPIPDMPYPRINDSRHFQNVVMFITVIGWILTILGMGIPALYRHRSTIKDSTKMTTNVVYIAA